LRRVVLALASSVALLFAFGGGTALACETFALGTSQARETEPVAYQLFGCQAEDSYEFSVRYEGTDDQGNATVEDRTLYTDGTATSGDTISGEFPMIDLGEGEKAINVFVNWRRGGIDQTPLSLSPDGQYPFTYVGKALPASTGTTGPAPSGATVPLLGTTTPIAATPPVTKKKTTKKKVTKKKPSSDGKSKKKSNSNTDNGSSDTPAVTTPTYTAPTITDSPSLSIPGDGGSSIDPPSLPEPSATAPPGLDGLAPNDGIPPVTPPPSTPLTAAPAAPVATSDEGMSLPIWLVMLLGLTAVLGLGGAQGRLLGFWGGPPRPINGNGNGNGNGTQDARLLALQRVAQSGASFQKRIAELKKAARDREPVG